MIFMKNVFVINKPFRKSNNSWAYGLALWETLTANREVFGTYTEINMEKMIEEEERRQENEVPLKE